MNVWDRLSYFVVMVILMAALAWTFFQYVPLFQTNTRLRKEAYALDVKIQQEERLNRQLRASIEAVQKDSNTVARLAREKLSFARTNETVFRFEAQTGKR